MNIKFWEGRPKSFLTLSVKIHEQEDRKILEYIKNLQQEIISELKKTQIIYDPYDVTAPKGLFKYPEDRLHFSLINFLTCLCKFEKFKELTKNDTNYKEIQKKIIRIVEENLFSSPSVSIRSLYDGKQESKKGKELNGFSLQVIPDKTLINKLSEIADKIKNEIHNCMLPNCNCSIDGKVKSYDNKFPMNILRFISLGWPEPIKSVINDDTIKAIDKIEKINQNLGEKPLLFNIKKIILVESDPFLYKWEKVKNFELK